MKSFKPAAYGPDYSLKTTVDYRLIFYVGWFALAVIQATFTQLQDDEAYYWVYARYIDWGYYDHPPVVALLVKLGTFLLPGEIGVRLLFILMNVGTVYLCELLTDRKNILLFYAICLSAVVLQISGFWAVPDVPLMFFTALFFYVYRQFLARNDWTSTCLLAFAMACLLYSKYHGLLVVVFAVFAYFTVLRNPKIYLAAILAFILYMPHLYWQYQHDWMTFKFHLFENKAHPYQVNFTLDYIFGQLLIAGPVAGIILLYATFKYKPVELVHKILKRTAVGIFIFFLLSTLRGQVEANWTSPTIVAMLVLTYQFLQENSAWRKWLYRLLPVSVALSLFIRCVMLWDILPVTAVVERFHAWKVWPQELQKKTGALPLVFYDSYQRASMYWFHTGTPAYSLSTSTQRRSNYNYWPVEDSLLGKPVYRTDIWNVTEYEDSIQARMWKIGFTKDEDFNAFAKIQLQPMQQQYIIDLNDLLTIDVRVQIPMHYLSYLKNHPEVDEQVYIMVFKKQELFKEVNAGISLRELLNKKQERIQIFSDLPAGDYQFIMAVSSDNHRFTHNSRKTSLRVKHHLTSATE